MLLTTATSTASLVGSTPVVVSRKSDRTPGQASASLQMQFDWDTQHADCIPSSSDSVPPTGSSSRGDATAAGYTPEIRRVRKLKRLSIGKELRSVPGGELWESESKSGQSEKAADASGAMERAASVYARSQSGEQTPRIAMPVKIGAAMLKLLKAYGISDAEIAAGMASYAQKTCRATAS